MAGKLEVGEFKGMADVSKQPRGAFLIGAKPASAGPPWQFPCVFQESLPWPGLLPATLPSWAPPRVPSHGNSMLPSRMDEITPAQEQPPKG